MIFLELLKTNEDDDWLDLAVNGKKAKVTQFTALRPNLEFAYDEYEKIVLNRAINLSSSAFGSDKELLVDYYKCPPKDLREKIKSRRNDHGLSECPYCGYPFAPDTLDHFIPKDSWPEFSIFPKNLVPQCKHCAPIKGKHYYCTVDNIATFIHPIYFNLLSKIGFQVVAAVNGDEPNFGIEFIVIEGMDSHEKAAVQKHLLNLKVKSRFRDYCVTQYFHWKRKICAQSFDIRQALQQRVNEKPNRGRFSTDWETAFCSGVLSCPALIEKLQRFAPTTQHATATIKVEALERVMNSVLIFSEASPSSWNEPKALSQ